MRQKRPLRFNIFRRFRKAENGATAIEFAMVGPLFIFLILAIFEVGFVFMIDLNLEHGLADAARKVRTGQITNLDTPEKTMTAMRREICDVVGVTFRNCESKLFLEAISVDNFDAIPATAATPTFGKDGSAQGSTADFGGAGTISVIRATIEWDVLANLPIIGLANTPAGNYRTTAVSVVRIE